MSTTDEQELMWAILKFDPKVIAHHYGRELSTLAIKKNKQKFNRRADEVLTLIMNTAPDSLAVIGIVKCWLSYYKLPLDTKKLTSFDRFHKNYSDIVIQNPAQIPIFYG